MKYFIIILIIFIGAFTFGYILTPAKEKNRVINDSSDNYIDNLIILEDKTSECQIPRFMLYHMQKAGLNINQLDESSWNKFVYKTKLEGIIDIEAEFGGNTLHFLTQTKNIQAIEKYLNLNISDVDAINKDGLTALAIALKNQDLDTVEILLNYGADLYNTMSIDGMDTDMLDIAMQGEYHIHSKYLKRLKELDMDFSEGEKYLPNAIKGNKELIKLLLPNTNLNAKLETGNHIFAEIMIGDVRSSANSEVINYFLDNGVEFHNIPSKLPPLNAAMQNRSISPDHIERMINAGANINLASTDMKETPLMLAVKNERLDLAEVLLANGAKVFIKNNLGENAFKYLTPEDNEMKELLESYSD